MRYELAQAVTGAVLAVLDTEDEKLVTPEEEEDEVGTAVMVPA